MKLYYLPGACSLAAHIAALEAGLPLTLELVSFGADGRTAGGKDYYAINPKGAVPAAEIDGEILTELAVILQYIAEQNPTALPMPSSGMAKWHFLETLNFMTTEVHKSFAPLFAPGLPDEAKPALLAVGKAKYDMLEQLLTGKEFVSGDSFTILDAYAFLLIVWISYFGLDLEQWPALKAFKERIGMRPSVQKALKDEGLA
jgi:glutathione S-transferase